MFLPRGLAPLIQNHEVVPRGRAIVRHGQKARPLKQPGLWRVPFDEGADQTSKGQMAVKRNAISDQRGSETLATACREDGKRMQTGPGQTLAEHDAAAELAAGSSDKNSVAWVRQDIAERALQHIEPVWPDSLQKSFDLRHVRKGRRVDKKWAGFRRRFDQGRCSTQRHAQSDGL